MNSTFIDETSITNEILDLVTKLVEEASSEALIYQCSYVEQPQQSNSNIGDESSSEVVTKRVTYKQYSGLGGMLASLRTEGPSTNPPQTGTSDDAPIQREPQKRKIDEVPSTSSDEPVLNRKQRRALKFQNQQSSWESAIDREKPEEETSIPAPTPMKPATPPCLELLDSDEDSFSHYKSSFGFSASRGNNYVHQVSLSSCGRYALATSQDRFVRVYDTKSNKLELSSKIGLGDLIYDAAWMPSTSMFATTARLHPVHLWNVDGKREATYKAFDYADQVEAASCISFIGQDRLYGGFNGKLRYWNLENGRKPLGEYPTFGDSGGMKGRVFSIDGHPTQEKTFVAAGTSTILAVYSENWKQAVWSVEGPARAYTFVKYSQDGYKVYASARKGNIYCFDMRSTKNEYQLFERQMNSNHRSRFDIDFENRLLYTGTSDGQISAFDISDPNTNVLAIYSRKVANTCVPSFSIDTRSRKMILCSGERLYKDSAKWLDDSDSECEEEKENESNNEKFASNSVQLWHAL